MRTFGLVHYGFVNNELWSWYRAGVQYCLDFDTTVFDVGSVSKQEIVSTFKIASESMCYPFFVSFNVIMLLAGHPVYHIIDGFLY